MPVVINEFEVVTDQAAPPATRSASSSEAVANEQGRGATPHEVELIMQHEKERLARVKAH
jgi:hypothetical protein